MLFDRGGHGSTMPWQTDAQFISDLNDAYLHSSAEIGRFLKPRDYDKFIVVASKGMGKTLLLRHKRQQIQHSPDGFRVIPHDEESDYVTLPASPSSELKSALCQRLFWQDLWSVAIISSVLMEATADLDKITRAELKRDLDSCHLPRIVADWFEAVLAGKTQHVRPSTILSELLQVKKSQLEQLRTEGLGRILTLYKNHVRSAVAVFIDSLDQELHTRYPNDLEIWCAGQGGLYKAAWELGRHNRHVKVYVTIRQEAYASFFDDPEITNTTGSVLLIKYTKEDLRAIFEKAMTQYEGTSEIGAFLGIDTMRNRHLAINEDVFDYIVRHTIGVPRWLMVMGAALSDVRPPRGKLLRAPKAVRELENRITLIVNSTSSDLASQYLEGELRPFFGGREPKGVVLKILRNIQSTVLTLANLRRLAQRYQADEDDPLTHPFCLLLNVGLLGRVEPAPASRNFIQSFKKPYEFDWNYEHILPDDDTIPFLLHPCLHHLAHLANARHFKYSRVRIGDDLPWTRRNRDIVRKDTINIFVSYSRKNYDIVAEIVEMLRDRLDDRARNVEIWLDKWKIHTGDWFVDRMATGVLNSEIFLLVVSKESMASKAVQAEWQLHFSAGLGPGNRVILPVIIDDSPISVLPSFLQAVQAKRLNPDAAAVEELASDILRWKFDS
jgi:hypothetical protein